MRVRRPCSRDMGIMPLSATAVSQALTQHRVGKLRGSRLVKLAPTRLRHHATSRTIRYRAESMACAPKGLNRSPMPVT